MPRSALTIGKPVLLKLRPFGINNVSQLTSIKADPLLLRQVEIVESHTQGVLEIQHVPSRVQRMPGPGACRPLARLEHIQQRVQPGNNLVKRHSQNRGRYVCLFIRMEKIPQLVRIRLPLVSFLPQPKSKGGNSPSSHTTPARCCTKPNNKSCTPRQRPSPPCTCC